METFKNTLRDIQPKEHPEIGRWLRDMAGDKYPKLEVWIANVTRLEKPDRVLYLAGGPATGKSLLVRGLARLWAKHPSRLSEVSGSFNEALLTCPLVHADEPPLDLNTDSFLENRPKNTRHSIQRKHRPPVRLENAIRVVVEAQEPPEDRSRCLFVPTTRSGALFSAVQAWIEKDQIAEHALYLREELGA